MKTKAILLRFMSRLIPPVHYTVGAREQNFQNNGVSYLFSSGGHQLYSGKENEGHDISVDEYKSGMLLRRNYKELRTLSSMNEREADQLPFAAVKSRCSDFQVVEINALGSPAFFNKAPKSKWNKVGRQKVMEVENSNLDFTEPNKTFSKRVMSYGEYAREWGNLAKEEHALSFVLYRERYSLENVMHRLQYELGIDSSYVFLRECDGGSYGCISQYGMCVGLTKEALVYASRHYNVHPLLFDPRSYCSLADVANYLLPASAYHYRIVLRCVTGTSSELHNMLKKWNDNGFINYFGIDRFGLGDNNLITIATHVGRGKLQHAVSCYLKLLADSDIFHYHHYMAYINVEESTVVSVVAKWLSESKQAKLSSTTIKFLEKLLQYQMYVNAKILSEKTDFSAHEITGKLIEEIWSTVEHEVRWRESAAEFVWNAITSQRILNYGLEVRKGDIVKLEKRPFHASDNTFLPLLKENNRFCTMTDNVPPKYKVVETDEEIEEYSIYDVVLPMPYSLQRENQEYVFPELTTVNRSLYEQFCKRHDFTFFLSNGKAGENTCREDCTNYEVIYRPILMKPRNVELSIVNDPSSLAALKSDLFLRQERYSVNNLSLDYNRRVREPCIYNVDEKFADKMSHFININKAKCGKNTVYLSFSLPATSSPLSALREVFTLKYLHVNDLIIK